MNWHRFHLYGSKCTMEMGTEMKLRNAFLRVSFLRALSPCAFSSPWLFSAPVLYVFSYRSTSSNKISEDPHHSKGGD